MRHPISATGMQGFVQWLQQRQPYLSRWLTKQLPREQLGSLGVTATPLSASLLAAPTPATASTATWIKDLLMGGAQVLLTKEQLKAQQKILDMQLERARAGLPPADIDPEQYGLPAPNVKLGIDADTKKVLLWGGGIAGGLLLLSMFFGGRRRRA